MTNKKLKDTQLFRMAHQASMAWAANDGSFDEKMTALADVVKHVKEEAAKGN